MKKALQVFLGVFGLTAIFIASLHVILGPSAILGSVPVNATMDSEDRFYATLFAAYGAALLWCLKGIEHKSRVVYFLALTFLVGGVARLVSMAAVGPPNAFFKAMTGLELSIPVLMVYMQSVVAKANVPQPGVRARSEKQGLPEKIVPMIHVPDVRATADWYQTIGFTLTRTHEDEGVMSWAALSFGSTGIMLNEGGRPSTQDRREFDLYVHADDVDALYQRLKDRVEVVEGLHDTFYGMREFIIRDCNRFWITFGQPAVNPRGRA